MMQVTIQMESRRCKNCQRPFRVLAKSNQSVCSTACDVFGLGARGVLRKESKAAENKTENVSVTFTEPTKRSEKRTGGETFSADWPTKIKKKNVKGDIIMNIETQKTETALSGHARIKPDNLETSEDFTNENGEISSPRSTPTETGVTLPVLSEESSNNFSREGLGSMKLLSKSANKLMDLLDLCVSETERERAKEGIQNLPTQKVDQCIAIANAISQTVQVQANVLKAAGAFIKD